MVGIGEGGAAEPLGRDLWGAIPARWRGRGGSSARGPEDPWTPGSHGPSPRVGGSQWEAQPARLPRRSERSPREEERGSP